MPKSTLFKKVLLDATSQKFKFISDKVHDNAMQYPCVEKHWSKHTNMSTMTLEFDLVVRGCGTFWWLIRGHFRFKKWFHSVNRFWSGTTRRPDRVKSTYPVRPSYKNGPFPDLSLGPPCWARLRAPTCAETPSHVVSNLRCFCISMSNFHICLAQINLKWYRQPSFSETCFCGSELIELKTWCYTNCV